MEPEPPPPSWLVAQNLLRNLAVAEDWTSIPESSQSQDNNSGTEGAMADQIPQAIQELLSNVTDVLDLENVIEASLQVLLIPAKVKHFSIIHIMIDCLN